MRRLIWIAALAAGLAARACADETVGKRPYELDWAGRQVESVAPVVDFEDLAGWRVETENSVARFERSREQQIWGSGVGKLTYRGSGSGACQVRLLPPAPIDLPGGFDAITLWCYGNNWGYAPDPATPQVTISAMFVTPGGGSFSVWLYTVDWSEWSLLHRRLTPEQAALVRGGARFAGLVVSGGRQKQDRIIYLDNLSVYTEQFAPLSFEPRPRRGIAPYPGQGTGSNTGPGVLPFPTTPDTILPPTTGRFANSAAAMGRGAILTCRAPDGVLRYTVMPSGGTLSDISAEWLPARGAAVRFRPCVDGGVWLRTATGPALPTRAHMLSGRLAGGVFEARWRLGVGGASADVTYRFAAQGRSLIMDVIAPGGGVAEVRYGRAVGLLNPRMVTHPFYPALGGRPATVAFGPPGAPLFLMGNTDWYRSSASAMWATNSSDRAGVTYNGGTRYTPLTNGRLVDCYDRLIITVSPRFEDTLPAIANPVSPWKRVTGTRVWRAHGAGDRAADRRYWADVERHGMTQVIVTDHETMWRDGGESFTFRTRAAPGKGGDAGAREYSDYMQKRLGFVYGPYNNFTDFAPVNEFWSTDLISRDPGNQLQHAWMRCYAPKPSRAVEYCARLSPINQSKYHFSTAYCDVHTAVAPWDRVDYDARAPGAGTMAAVYYAYGEIMLLQKRAWNGPVYSEGNHHAFYTGLTDGNYGQDQAYRPAENPWLVDFDLRRMHDLGCNFGMGAPDMFYANVAQPMGTREARDAWLDRFLAATVAFGHPGFLVMDGGLATAMRSYFMLQQLHSRYCLARAIDIRYVDAAGRLLTSSEAVASGAFRRSQVVTRYSDGTVTAANGSRTERLRAAVAGRRLDLPPNGYAGWSADGAVDVLSADRGGARSDYAVTPSCLYVDGRGTMVRFPRAAGNGQGVCRVLGRSRWEVILMDGADCGFAVPASRAVALDKERREIGRAEVRVARGLAWVMPVSGAVSYLLSGPGVTPRVGTAPATEVLPGERPDAQSDPAWRVPADAKPGARLWRRTRSGWVDYTALSPFDFSVTVDESGLHVALSSRLRRDEVFDVEARGARAQARVRSGGRSVVTLPLGAPEAEDAETLEVRVAAAGIVRRLEVGLRTSLLTRPLLAMPAVARTGVGLRGSPEQAGFGTTGAHVNAGRCECDGVGRDALQMHPAWLGGAVGYAYALTEPVALPASDPAAFRALVGKMDGSDPGDGILYRVVVVDQAGRTEVAAERVVTEHGWFLIEADLSRWAGRRVSLKLVADPGPADSSGGDWACWAEMRIETRDPVLRRSIEPDAERYRRSPGPFPVAELTVADLRGAVSGWIRYDGKGLNGGAYQSFGMLNGIELGPLAEAGGDETRGVFAERVAAPLSSAAIASLGRVNRFTVRNPARDYFSIRRAWIELRLADGRRVSSDIAAATFTQPAEWPYAEGIRVPFGTDIEFPIWFRER